MLSGFEDIEITGEASKGEEVIIRVDELEPDVVLMSQEMSLSDGTDVTSYLSKEKPDAKVLLLTHYEDRERITTGLKAGARGLIARTASPSELISAIVTVHNGNHFLTPSIARAFIEAYNQYGYDRKTNANRRKAARKKHT